MRYKTEICKTSTLNKKKEEEEKYSQRIILDYSPSAVGHE